MANKPKRDPSNRVQDVLTQALLMAVAFGVPFFGLAHWARWSAENLPQ
ncbi:hypothetical protein [Terrihabitans rhizophilus]|uniref:Uncharacterized protein n=1 Tax=Terrihabitans rhizophilus TaxID=3092662 RepID=A0ABU4RNF0_9HYPH|nr:hypothetical protein [Terrihabitans sp. PJ23]MDX6806339.1 hypothetical protein [Terrihabitans sp. PJ23]